HAAGAVDLLDVGAGAEGLDASAGEDRDPHGRIIGDVLPDIAQPFLGRYIQCIEYLRAIERDQGNAVRALLKEDRHSERSWIAPAIDQQVLPGDIARLRRAEIGEIRTELRRIAVAFGRTAGGSLSPDLIETLAEVAQHALDVAPLRVTVEDAREQVVD